jgi:short-subunit dehydrogenase
LLRDAQDFRRTYGPWAVVTGASSGIDVSFAVELARAGLHLVLVARSTDVLRALGTELSAAHGIDVRVLTADLATNAGIALVKERTATSRSACSSPQPASAPRARSSTAKRDQELSMLDVNCRALIDLCLHYTPAMAGRGRGGWC